MTQPVDPAPVRIYLISGDTDLVDLFLLISDRRMQLPHEITVFPMLSDLLAAIQRDPPDIVIVAWSYVRDDDPRPDTLRETEACRRIRALPEGADLPLVLITTRPDQRRPAWDLGVNAFASFPPGAAMCLDALLAGVLAGRRVIVKDSDSVGDWFEVDEA